jgi:CsoR family transcriptional regulator, copper-sensing transcriptional repressor
MTAVADTGRPNRSRAPGSRQDAEISSRLRKATGQLSGVTGMVEDGRYCIDVLDQLSAVRAAIDAVALLVLSDHINACVRAAIQMGDTDEKVTELVGAVRRYVRSQ